jgi:cell wall assembly regulator SMI1
VAALAETWDRIHDWLKANAPVVLASLGPPATDEQLREAEQAMGVELPGEVKDCYRIHDGQRVIPTPVSYWPDLHCVPAFLYGEDWLNLADMVMVWRGMRDLLAQDRFRLYAVCSRFPHNLSEQVPWQALQPGVYDCRWGLDKVQVVVAGQLPREAHNAPLQLFSASPELVGFAGGAYRRRSEQTSRLLGQLFDNLRAEGFAVSFTMEDFNRQYVKEHFARLTPEERAAVLQALPPEERLAGLPPEQRLAGLSAEQMEQIRQHLERLTTGHAVPHKRRRKS